MSEMTAREAAEEKYPVTGRNPDNERDAFVRGAEWQASQPPTDAQVEAGARVWFDDAAWARALEGERIWQRDWARAVLEAARKAVEK